MLYNIKFDNTDYVKNYWNTSDASNNSFRFYKEKFSKIRSVKRSYIFCPPYSITEKKLLADLIPADFISQRTRPKSRDERQTT